MQRNSGKLRNAALRVVLTLGLMVIVGCSKRPTAATTPTQPHRGITLKIACADKSVLDAFADRALGWASRTGATVERELVDPRLATDADLLIVTPTVLGELAERRELLPIPDEFKSLDHPADWIRLLPAYRDRVSNWGGEVVGLPLAGESLLLVVRMDRLQEPVLAAKYAEMFRRNLPSKPQTWDDLAEIAEACHALGRPALPPRSERDRETAADFLRIAACYDRPAWTDTDLSKKDGTAPASMELITFLFKPDTGEPRLSSPGFADALAWMRRVEQARGANAKLADGSAAFATLTIAELRDLFSATPPGDCKHLSILPLPGTRTARGLDGRMIDCSRQPGGNYVPFYDRGWCGVVRKNTASSAAAFELLADLGSPTRGLELLSDPQLAFGPFRQEHLESARAFVWDSYGFNAEHQNQLMIAFRRNAAASVVNPALALRGPEAIQLQNILAKTLQQGNTIDFSTLWPASDTTNRLVRRHSAGLP